jgi:hypothetical protein
VSRLWRERVRVGLCPDRLVLAGSTRPVEELEALCARFKATVVLSSHYVRYAVLPWSEALRTQEEWAAFAQHAFASTYGNLAAAWQVRVCDTGRRRARIASAVDAALVEKLRALGAVSVQPWLMAAFNARRRMFNGQAAWFVLQEHGRLTASLIAQGEWKLIRNRQANGNWREELPGILDRESADCDQALLCAEEEAPATLGRYRVSAVHTSPYAMAVH